MRRRHCAVLTLAALASLPAWAAAPVSLNGTLGKSAALLVIRGQVKTVRMGQTVDGVKLLEVSDARAVVEFEGERLELRLGASPVAQGGGGAAAQGSRIVLFAESGGHFYAQGSINGGAVRFLVDTGATAISLSSAQANRLGIDYTKGRPIRLQTANGVIKGYAVNLDRVRIGDVELNGVAATIAERDMPIVLLGNSFLSRFQMKRENDNLILERRY